MSGDATGVPALNPPQTVVELVGRLERAGYETWCVGGAVRDALLGHAHLDWDMATAATPPQIMKVFRRTVPLGVEFGTVGVFDSAGVMHEVTTFRRDVETDGRHAVVKFGVSFDDDLARRDFTINAIAYSPSARTIHDPFGGREDLARGLIRTVGDPDARLEEDRLRALRALRFAARFGFRIEPATWRAIERSAPHLTRLSAERVRQEIEKTMEQVDRPGAALAQWQASGALAVLIPSLAAVPAWALTVPDFLPCPVLPRRPQRRVNRITALFLTVPARTAEAALKALRFSNLDAAWIAGVLDRWRRLEPQMAAALVAPTMPTPATIRRWVADAGRTRFPAVMRLAVAAWRAEAAAGRPAPPLERVGSIYRQAVRAAYRDPIELSDLAVDGDDLNSAGFAPGPAVGKILHVLLAAVLEEPSLNTRERLLEIARGQNGI